MNKNKVWEKFFECECHGEGIMVSAEWYEDLPNHPTIDLAYWNEGYRGNKLSFWLRIRFAWRILRTGRPWHDMIQINKETAKELGEHLLSLGDKK